MSGKDGNIVTTTELSEWLTIGDDRIRQLTDQGILTATLKGRVRYYDLRRAVNEYIIYVKSAGTNAKEKLVNADLRFKNSKAERSELELAELKGQMHRSEDVMVVVSDMIARLRAAILSLPGRLAVDCSEARTPTEASAVIKDAVDEILNETADVEYNEKDYRRLVMEREKWLNKMEDAQEEKKMEATGSTNTPKSRKRATSSKASAAPSKRRKTSR